jgi:hypothetical protein
MPHVPLLLHLAFKFPLEDVERDLKRTVAKVERWCKRAMFTRRGVALVVVTDETPRQLVDRLRSTLESVTTLEDFWCHSLPADVAGRHGNLDTLEERGREAWAHARKLNETQHMRKPKGRNWFGKHGPRDVQLGAPVEMSVYARAERKPPRKFDREKG